MRPLLLMSILALASPALAGDYYTVTEQVRSSPTGSGPSVQHRIQIRALKRAVWRAGGEVLLVGSRTGGHASSVTVLFHVQHSSPKVVIENSVELDPRTSRVPIVISATRPGTELDRLLTGRLGAKKGSSSRRATRLLTLDELRFMRHAGPEGVRETTLGAMLRRTWLEALASPRDDPQAQAGVQVGWSHPDGQVALLDRSGGPAVQPADLPRPLKLSDADRLLGRGSPQPPRLMAYTDDLLEHPLEEDLLARQGRSGHRRLTSAEWDRLARLRRAGRDPAVEDLRWLCRLKGPERQGLVGALRD